jgi:hypothetical protein
VRQPAGEVLGPSGELERAQQAVRALGPAPTPRAATSTFSRTLSPPNRWPCWKVRASRAERARRTTFQRVTSRPSTSTAPCVGRSKPVITLMSVVFPAPFGPMSPTTSPRRTSRSTASSAWTPRKLRLTAAARSDSLM